MQIKCTNIRFAIEFIFCGEITISNKINMHENCICNISIRSSCQNNIRLVIRFENLHPGCPAFAWNGHNDTIQPNGMLMQ